jgi:hypothetical protein
MDRYSVCTGDKLTALTRIRDAQKSDDFPERVFVDLYLVHNVVIALLYNKPSHRFLRFY